MKRINFLLIILLTVTLSNTFATAQEPDIIIYNGDTLSLYAFPLEQLYKNELKRPDFFRAKKGCMNTGCWRGYQAEWRIIDNELYLTGIFSCCYREDNIKADLKKLFGNKYINGKVKADWVTANIIAPTGKYIYYMRNIDEMVYEGELEFQFINGRLIGTKTYDNSKSRLSIYPKDENKLLEFIYSNIHWNYLPKHQDKVIKVIVRFSGSEKGTVDSVQVLRGYDTIFDQEAIRVIKAIPDWDILYRHGKPVWAPWTLPIVFNKENEEKYRK
jgi:hypothetical protein